MLKIEPQASHPFHWVLVDVLQMTRRDVARLSGVSLATLARLESGHSVDDDTLHTLAQFIDASLADLFRQPMSQKLTERHRKPSDFDRHWHVTREIQEYRAHVVAVVRHVLQTYSPPPPQPRATPLSERILATLGTAGEYRSRAISLAKGRNTSHAVRRCAARIGVREVQRDGRTFWLPPPRVASIAPRPVPLPIYRKSRRQSRIQTILEMYLVKHPDGVSAHDAVAHVAQRAQCNRTQVYRAAADLRVDRETTGFGPTKRTTWRYQPAIDLVHKTPSRIDRDTQD